jgi:CDP-diacylglycerol---serine O-phosphatidyltransferase
MAGQLTIPKNVTTILVYSRPPLVFAGLICAIAVMWTRNPIYYPVGVALLFISMSFDVIDGWFAARFHPYPTLARLADRIMDRVVYSIIFPLIAVGVMWRLMYLSPNYSKQELLHAIFILILCVTALIRDNFAHFMRGFAIRQGQEPEAIELNRVRTMVTAPVGALLYAYAFYIPQESGSILSVWASWIGNMPLRALFLIEIIFLIITFGSIAGYCRKYGNYCLDQLSLGDPALRRHILTFFPNALTVMNALMGLLSIFFAYQGRIREAYLILIGAAFFDKLDGALARKLGLTTPPSSSVPPNRISVGSLLDDISDAVSFCIAPGWIFFLCLSQAADPELKKFPIGLVSWIYITLGITRLIYFTLDRKPIPGFFKGFPTPAAALLVVAPLIMLSQTTAGMVDEIRFWGLFSFCLMIASSLLMNIYPIRFIHYGRFMSRHPLFVSVSLVFSFLFVFTPYFGHFSLLCMLIYALSPLWTWQIAPEIAAQETRIKKRA